MTLGKSWLRNGLGIHQLCSTLDYCIIYIYFLLALCSNFVIRWIHEVVFCWIGPLVHQSQYLLFRLAVALYRLKKMSFPSTLVQSFWRQCWELNLQPSASTADALTLSHSPSLNQSPDALLLSVYTGWMPSFYHLEPILNLRENWATNQTNTHLGLFPNDDFILEYWGFKKGRKGQESPEVTPDKARIQPKTEA